MRRLGRYGHASGRKSHAMFLHAGEQREDIGRRMALDVASCPVGVEVVVLPPPCPLPVQPIDFSHARKLIELGRAGAERQLDAQELNLPSAV